MLAIVILGVVLPLTCYKEAREERALVSALVMETPFVDGASIGSVATSWEHYPAHVASSLLGAVVLGVVLRAFFRQLPDVLACLHERRWALPAFLVTQSVALITLSVSRCGPAARASGGPAARPPLRAIRGKDRGTDPRRGRRHGGGGDAQA